MFHHARLASFATTLAAVFLALAAVPRLKAIGFNHDRTRVTFSGPVQIENDALPAGSYVFRTLGPDRNIVEVMNAAETHSIGLFDTIPVSAPAVPTKTEIVFSRPVAGAPALIHEWFLPGQNIGWEFPALKHKGGRW